MQHLLEEIICKTRNRTVVHCLISVPRYRTAITDEVIFIGKEKHLHHLANRQIRYAALRYVNSTRNNFVSVQLKLNLCHIPALSTHDSRCDMIFFGFRGVGLYLATLHWLLAQ